MPLPRWPHAAALALTAAVMPVLLGRLQPQGAAAALRPVPPSARILRFPLAVGRAPAALPLAAEGPRLFVALLGVLDGLEERIRRLETEARLLMRGEPLAEPSPTPGKR